MRNLYIWIWLGRILYWVVWPGSWLYLRGSQRTRMLLLRGDEILVVKNWLGAGKWNLPGGGLHKDEDPRVGLLREVREETAIRLDLAMVQPLASEVYRKHGFWYMGHYFTAVVGKKPPTVPQRFEILDIAWLRRSDVSPGTCDSDVLRALELQDLRSLDSDTRL